MGTILKKISERLQFLHQQVYVAFIICMVSSYVGGAFLKGILIFIWNQTVSICVTIWNIIYSILSKIGRGIKSLLLALLEKIKEKLPKREPKAPSLIKKSVRGRKGSIVENGVLSPTGEIVEESESIAETE